jgi:hypothetical protein
VGQDLKNGKNLTEKLVQNTLPTQPKSNVNAIKKPKPEYLTHKKNALSFGGTIGGNTKLKVRK